MLTRSKAKDFPVEAKSEVEGEVEMSDKELTEERQVEQIESPVDVNRISDMLVEVKEYLQRITQRQNVVEEETKTMARMVKGLEAERYEDHLRVIDFETRLVTLEDKFSVLESKVDCTAQVSEIIEQKIEKYGAKVCEKLEVDVTEIMQELLRTVEQLDKRITAFELEGKFSSKKSARLNTDTSTPKDSSRLSSFHTPEKHQSRLTVLKPIQQPPTFDGKSSWEAFFAQFNIAASMNNWSEGEKAAFLATSLQGNATLVLSNLSEDDRRDFNTLVASLTSRFGVTHQSELARAKLKTRFRRKDESLRELVEAIESLTHMAYPEASPELQDVLAKDHFIDALTEEELRLRIRLAKPKSLQAALETALELESFELASRHRSKSIRLGLGNLRLVEEERNQEFYAPPNKGEPRRDVRENSQLHKLESMIAQVLEEIRPLKSPRNHRSPPPRRRNDGCYNCGKLGHFARECTSGPARRPFTEPSNHGEQRESGASGNEEGPTSRGGGRPQS